MVRLAHGRSRAADGLYRDDPVGHCRAQGAVYLPPTFGDSSDVRLAPDICTYPTEWPERIGPYWGALLAATEGLVHGSRDNTPLAGNREWVAGQPNARLFVVEGAGHWPHYERPDVTIPAIERFLSGGGPL